MKKSFNIAGRCFPTRHYMMDMSDKLRQVIELVEEGDYFTINRPRQYGKTTLLHALNDFFEQKEAYLQVKLNFQGMDEFWFESDKNFAVMFVKEMIRALHYPHPKLAKVFKNLAA